MPKIIDLFAGAGGLSLGAARAGFTVVAAVELDDFAIGTHKKNFPASKHLQHDISKISGKKLLELAGLKAGELDGLIGGPPCQGFSTIGKRQVDDARNDMFSHFFRLVKATSPAFFVAENVTGILNSQYDSVRNKALSVLPKKYVLLEPFKVKASEHGAPTTRTRVFFIGYDPKKMKGRLNQADFVPSTEVGKVLVKEALLGLPKEISSDWLTEEQGWRKIDHSQLLKTSFFERITGAIPKNIGNKKFIERYQNNGLVSGCMGTKHSQEVEARYAALGYGEQDPISKSMRLNPEGFCPTLRAGTGSDKGSFQAVRPIHYNAARVITPREAARLQGFPDWFVFHATKWHSFRQIGNSVSPIVAESILTSIFKKY